MVDASERKSRKVRLEDIARMCGVSLSTVSRALAGEKGVRPEVRERILLAAQAANYALPTRVAGKKVMLAASSAAMIDYVRNQFTLYVLEGLNERARALGIEIVTRPVASRADEMAALAEARADDEIAGVLFLTLDDEEMLTVTRGYPKPIVLVNGDDPQMEHTSVTPCNRSAARLATEHLISLGHRDILFLQRRGRRTIERRREGWSDALIRAGITAGPERIVEVDDWLPELSAAAIRQRVDEQGLDFTAVLAAGDSLAIGAMLGLQQQGIRVPTQVSVVGMDDLPQAAFLSPPLTTIHIPKRELGSTALDLLSDALSAMRPLARQVELSCHLVERQSSARRWKGIG